MWKAGLHAMHLITSASGTVPGTTQHEQFPQLVSGGARWPGRLETAVLLQGCNCDTWSQLWWFFSSCQSISLFAYWASVLLPGFSELWHVLCANQLSAANGLQQPCYVWLFLSNIIKSIVARPYVQSLFTNGLLQHSEVRIGLQTASILPWTREARSNDSNPRHDPCSPVENQQ